MVYLTDLVSRPFVDINIILYAQEFTQFVVEKANILNKRLKMTSIAHYSENTDSLDSSLVVRHRHDATSMIDIAPLGLVALVVRRTRLYFDECGQILRMCLLFCRFLFSVHFVIASNNTSV